MSDPVEIGDPVEWRSTKTGAHHVGRVVAGDNGIGKVLVRPDNAVLDWSAWEPIENVTPLKKCGELA